jgi:hypothetical protein
VISGKEGEDKIEDESGDNNRLYDDDCEIDMLRSIY